MHPQVTATSNSTLEGETKPNQSTGSSGALLIKMWHLSSFCTLYRGSKSPYFSDDDDGDTHILIIELSISVVIMSQEASSALSSLNSCNPHSIPKASAMIARPPPPALYK